MDGFKVGRRLSGGGFNSPNRRLRGLAGLGNQLPAVRLIGADVDALLARHSDARAKVIAFESQVAADRLNSGGYFQGAPGYAIPEWGFAVADSVFGNVTIFPDAAGDLQYTGNVPQTVADQTNMGPYTPPPPENPLAPWEALLKYGPYVLAAGGALWLFSLLPRKR